ncbi:MAG: glycosyl hydrolase, partial [Pseudomonadota bacterium]
MKLYTFLASAALILASESVAYGASDLSIAAGFAKPPHSAKPSQYWFWTDGNITREGIETELKWMAEAGYGAVNLFFVTLGPPQIIEDYVDFGTSTWYDHVAFAAEKARELGIDIYIHTSAGGFVKAGGPWITPDRGMKKYVWSETRVTGGQRFTGTLPMPPSNAGPYQDVPRGTYAILTAPDPVYHEVDQIPFVPKKVPDWYVDEAVVAFRMPSPAVELEKGRAQTRFTNGDVVLNPEQLQDARYEHGQALVTDSDGTTEILMVMPDATLVSAVTLGMGRDIVSGTIEGSVDGETWQLLSQLPGDGHPYLNIPGHGRMNAFVRSYAFEPTQLAQARVRLTEAPRPMVLERLAGLPSTDQHVLTEFRAGYAGINRLEEKAGFSMLMDYAAQDTTPVTGDVITQVIDLSSKMDSSGQLDWEAPPGEWMIIRLGYSPTGRHNFPATRGGLGLE